MNADKRAPLDQLWAEIPTGTPPVAEMMRNGRNLRRHRHRMTALTVTAVSALIVGGAAVAQQTIGTTTQTPSITPADTVAPHPKAEVVVYYLVDKPERADSRFRPATRVTPRSVTVEGTGDPAFDAIHALLTAEPPETGLSSGFNFLDGPDEDETVDVNAVRHQGGVITIDLSGDPWDPYPYIDFCCPPDGAVVTQQLVLTAQTALDTDDPVRFTTNGKPVSGVWFHRLDAPVQADPSIVLSTALDGTWTVRALVGRDGQSVLPAPYADKVQMTFNDGEMRGNAGCNEVWGTYKASGDRGEDLVFPRAQLTSYASCDEAPLVTRLLDVRYVSGSGDVRYLHAENWMIVAELHRR